MLHAYLLYKMTMHTETKDHIIIIIIIIHLFALKMVQKIRVEVIMPRLMPRS